MARQKEAIHRPRPKNQLLLRMPPKMNDKNDVGTPPILIDKIQNYTGKHFSIDLAASDKYHVCPTYWTPDYLVWNGARHHESIWVHWREWIATTDYFWLNPPYDGKSLSSWFYLAVAIANVTRGGVILVNSNVTGTKAFQRIFGAGEHERQIKGAELYFPAGRLSFRTERKTSSYPYSSMAIILQGGVS